MNKQLRTLAAICLFATLATGNAQAATAPVKAVKPMAAKKWSAKWHAVSTETTATVSTSLQSVDSYTIYYGQPSATAIRTLSSYEMVVLEPRLWSAEQLRTLKQSGVKVLGYLSILEQHESSELLRSAEDGDYLTVSGQRDFRTEWNSWSMNINSLHYRSLLIGDLERQIVQKGLDGVFLDTVGNVDDGIWPDSISDVQRDGVVSFLSELSVKYPNLSLMQNWGLGALKDRTAPYIDGILWEDFNPTVVTKDAWSCNRMAELDKLETTGLAVFTVKIGATAKVQTSFTNLNRQHGYVGQIIKKSYDVL